ncbi:acyl-CoA dehydrogenase family protein [Thermoplasma sp.]|uniref:acyl-CoA dehydrogenase family protein n=1 Tax=Thermoplasma sp. TaxID=1973142 RepID=UPI001280E46A|nr:acyl-CoA dehydrogenase family protein [Thermoplasma sp.]KAA8922250.1 MAG: hypothetical protein F6Q11_05480 [Thermoplasma sp.]
MDEEHKILESMVSDFVQREVSPVSKAIETQGIPQELLSKMARQGLIGATVPQDLGGSDLDRLGYVILLKQIAMESPSLAFLILMENSYVMRVLEKAESGNDIIKKIAAGSETGTVTIPTMLGIAGMGSLEAKAGRISGTIYGILNPSARIHVVCISPDSFYVVDGGYKVSSFLEQLGFRGMKFSSVSYDFDVASSIHVEHRAKDLLEDSAIGIAAIAIGISYGALNRAISYSGERKAFGHYLREFQPVAFTLASHYMDLDITNEYLMSLASGPKDAFHENFIKAKALDLAISISRSAIQIHGGYGYFVDFGVERFYRDAMFLKNISGDHMRDMERLSDLIFGETVKRI